MVRNLLTAVTVGVLALGLTSCASTSPGDEAEKEAGDLCGITGDHTAEKALSGLLGTKDLKTADDGAVLDVAKEMKRGLTDPLSPADSSERDVCSLYPRTLEGSGDLAFSFGWRYKYSIERESEPLDDYTYYNLDGAIGESSPERSHLYVPCTPPKNASPQRDRFLIAHVENSISPRSRDAKGNPRDNQLTALQAVARKMARAVGCTNDPLQGKPDLTPYDTLRAAVRAGQSA
ncbi:hypothetical protein [Streptomyces sp. NPDC053560]|uniref:hypothetical protein n=1 Tax=Streptomyces sp. NPDC053560 TaxID=3365711 RepID=UPI0037D154FC